MVPCKGCYQDAEVKLVRGVDFGFLCKRKEVTRTYRTCIYHSPQQEVCAREIKAVTGH